MRRSCPIIIVSGFLGSGKSRITRSIAATADVVVVEPAGAEAVGSLVRAAAGPDAPPDAVVVEADGLKDPRLIAADCPESHDVRVVTVVDAVNLVACLEDAALAGLVRAQIAAANCLILARGDVVDPGATRSAIAGLVQTPMLQADLAAVSLEAVLSAARSAASAPAGPPIDLSGAYATWSYHGPAVLTPNAAEALLRDRPKGAWRIKGCVLTPSGAIDLQVFGRGRQTLEVEAPAETTLAATGPKPLFRVKDMDWAFSEAVIASSYQTGIIACR